MTQLIDLACRIADVHHRYHEIHASLFGAASFRLIVSALRGTRRRAYRDHAQMLAALQEELHSLEPAVLEPALSSPSKVSQRELQQVLLDYTHALEKAVSGLAVIFENLEQDETAYRAVGVDGRSGFTRDKLSYDHRLLELERLGTRLNRLFANY